MVFENLLFASIIWLCALIFAGIAVWAFKLRTPMHFWSGSSIDPAQITDIPAYNRANGVMWAVYASALALSGAIGLFSLSAGTVLAFAVCVPGCAVLIFAYHRIFRKYRAY